MTLGDLHAALTRELAKNEKRKDVPVVVDLAGRGRHPEHWRHPLVGAYEP
jgi:hypothetical protein